MLGGGSGTSREGLPRRRVRDLREGLLRRGGSGTFPSPIEARLRMNLMTKERGTVTVSSAICW